LSSSASRHCAARAASKGLYFRHPPVNDSVSAYAGVIAIPQQASFAWPTATSPRKRACTRS
jgi:hypothetical protein